MIIFGGFESADLPSYLAAEQELLQRGIPCKSIKRADFLAQFPYRPWTGELPQIPLLKEFLEDEPNHELALRELLSFLTPRSEQVAAKFLDEVRPTCVVLCPGHWESQALGSAAHEKHIPVIWLAPVYFAWKACQPFSFVTSPSDIHITVGQDAADRLMKKGISRTSIHILGTPILDDFPAITDIERTRAEKNTILFATQAIEEDLPLFDHLLNILANSESLSLRLRPHPVTPKRQLEELRAAIPKRLESRVSWSDKLSLRDDILRSSAVMSHSSSLLIFALLLEKPAYAWNPTHLPSELTAAEVGLVQVIDSLNMLDTCLKQTKNFPFSEVSDKLTTITGPRGGAAARIAHVIAQIAGVEKTK